MRHKVRTRTLGRQTGHRIAMLRNMAISLLEHEKITTTLTRAHEVSRFTDRLINMAIKAKNAESEADALAYKRRVFDNFRYSTRVRNGNLHDSVKRSVAQDLFEKLAVQFSDRKNEEGAACNGGYTRITHLGCRKGDGAPMAIVELVL
ncbi:50S ribosomal protein L17 [bacterium]|nr:50S ribosomal protein L17 [bacterium]